MIFEQIKAGGDRNFAYLIGDEGSRRCAVLRTSGNPKKLLARRAWARRGLRLQHARPQRPHERQ